MQIKVYYCVVLMMVTTTSSQAESQCVYTMENVLDRITRLGSKLETIEKRLEKIESRQDAWNTGTYFISFSLLTGALLMK
jgi:hypothetical protein